MTLIRPTRRDLLRLAAIAPAFAMPATARAMLGAPTAGNPAHFSFTLGEARLTVVSDGYFSLPGSGLAVNAPEEEKIAFLKDHYLDPERGYSHTNHLYIEIGEARVLIDVGSGTRWLDTTGRLMGNLEAAGIDPMGITHVVITHAHPDHIWGIRDDFDEPIIPDAEYIIGETERTYWLQDGLVDQVSAERQQFVVGAVNAINAEGVEWTLVGGGAEVVPGVTLLDSPGHTPGHLSVMIDSGGQQLIATGDALTHAYTNFAHPDWFNDTDTDGEMTVASRRNILDMAASDRIAMLGYHFPFPGVGHVRRVGEAFEFVPALWQF
ncbi:MBL fold metallo-hydrolase [Aliiroseovarius sp. S2029]|uniref:MBL fold metallo-hydrolase n=1 Tax=Aliiroseovarius sp. S2029 TaxID=2936988 RepID=UPI0020BDBCD6|nr:MBL fold metallo-hydrolase [Aliiroseovarius sp. S2029]MCK8484879.1 MBL fold metallo-hydrolase [Aliiroseovarius sp. S2029]